MSQIIPINPKTNAPFTSEEFVETVLAAKYPGAIPQEIRRHFCEIMTRAKNHGRICTPERMAKLYPIFREICDEIDEIEAEYQAGLVKHRPTDKKKAVRRNRKQNQLQAVA